MPRDPTGTYTAPSNSFNPAVDATVIDPADWNAILLDLSDAMTDSLSRTAEGGMEDTLDMDGHPIINATIDTAGPNTIQVTGVTIGRGQYPGTTTNDNATAGNVGEVLQGIRAVGSQIGLTTATAADITSVSLTAGDWDVYGNITFTAGASTSFTSFVAAIGTVTATLPTAPGSFNRNIVAAVVPGSGNEKNEIVGPYRISLNSTTTIYLVGRATFTAGTTSAYGIIEARRAR